MEQISQLGELMKVWGTSLEYRSNIIQTTFIKGLPSRLHLSAYTTQEGLDELVSTIFQMVYIQKRNRMRRQ